MTERYVNVTVVDGADNDLHAKVLHAMVDSLIRQFNYQEEALDPTTLRLVPLYDRDYLVHTWCLSAESSSMRIAR